MQTTTRRGSRQRGRRHLRHVQAENAHLRARLGGALCALRFDRRVIRAFLPEAVGNDEQPAQTLQEAMEAIAGGSDQIKLIERELDRERPTGHMVQQDVEELHRELGGPVGETPAIRRPELRARITLEEAAETAAALLGATVEVRVMPVAEPGAQWEPIKVTKLQSLTEVIDGVCDSLCVNYGTAVECGFNVAPFWDEVHSSNLAKKGGGVREDGKHLKPEGWQPPDIEGVLAAQTAPTPAHELEVASA